MLNESQLKIIKSTVPLLKQDGETLAKHFYHTMLSEYTDVRPLFNKANQISGAQPRALANSILNYAMHIDQLDQLKGLVGTITHKHVALQILPEHYPIVGTCLLRAIKEVLGSETATDEVIEAWRIAYTQLASILINTEEELYQHQEDAVGGWRGERLFRVAKKTPESTEVTSFYLEPKDGKAIISYEPGQFLGIRFILLEGEQRRNYSISEIADGKHYRISVKKIKEGVISNHLHDQVQEGDILRVFPPIGEFVLEPSNKPLVLISGGIGITPLIPILQAALPTKRPIYFIHAAHSEEIDAFRQWVLQQQATHDNLTCYYCYTIDTNKVADTEGHIDQNLLSKWLPANKDLDAYVLGPKSFMADMIKSLQTLQVPPPQIHYEFFGPASDLTN